MKTMTMACWRKVLWMLSWGSVPAPWLCAGQDLPELPLEEGLPGALLFLRNWPSATEKQHIRLHHRHREALRNKVNTGLSLFPTGVLTFYKICGGSYIPLCGFTVFLKHKSSVVQINPFFLDLADLPVQ